MPLNPARGDASPQAGVLWGDIREDRPSGVLLKFADGFTSPPHIHNITYRAMVIRGAIHNDDPDAPMNWMHPGSFWTQPAGDVHITAARPGAPGVAFLEILEGPYLVQPVERAFDNGEHAVNLEYADMQWQPFPQPPNADAGATRDVVYTPLWRRSRAGKTSAMAVRMAPGARVEIQGDELKAVVIAGVAELVVPDEVAAVKLAAGGYMASDDVSLRHRFTCRSDVPCVLYLRTRVP
ncbi:MAG: DUF4437 domain-containing protein [Pseudomonadota bacterium]